MLRIVLGIGCLFMQVAYCCCILVFKFSWWCLVVGCYFSTFLIWIARLFVVFLVVTVVVVSAGRFGWFGFCCSGLVLLCCCDLLMISCVGFV